MYTDMHHKINNYILYFDTYILSGKKKYDLDKQLFGQTVTWTKDDLEKRLFGLKSKEHLSPSRI